MTVSSPGQPGQVFNAADDDLTDSLEKIQVQGVDGVAGLMIMGIAEICRVREHDSPIALVPERGVIAPAHIRQAFSARGDGQGEGGRVRRDSPGIAFNGGNEIPRS